MEKRALSFKYAFEGIVSALKEEPNLKFHFLIGLVVVGLGILLNITTIDWILVIILVGLVVSVELTNTAIETVVDHIIKEEHPEAKMAKDISAGAVLVVSITAAIAGILIFLPYLNG